MFLNQTTTNLFSIFNSQQTTTKALPTFLIFLLTIPSLLIISLTVFGNLLVLLFKARVGRKNTTLLVWNLGLTDFLVGLFVLPVGAIYLTQRKWIFGRLMCRIWVGADVTFCTCSVVTICVISVDRYFAVTKPLRYKSLVTTFKIIVVIVCIWIFSFGVLLCTIRWDLEWSKNNDTCFAGHEIRYLAHSVVFAFFLPASVTLTLYWRIYKLARNRQKALDRGFLMILGHNMNFLTNTLSQTTALRVHVGKNKGMVEQQRRVLRTHERIAKTLGVISCSFLFCWLPFFTLYLLNYKCNGCFPSLIIDIASWLGYCNSMLNPIIYSFTVREFKRSALCAILPLWKQIYKICPKYLCKPPDSQRIIRKKQQQLTKTNQQQQKTWTTKQHFLLPTNNQKRYVPPREKEKGAVSSLMVSANCVTSALMGGGNEGRKKEEKEKELKEEEDNLIKNGFLLYLYIKNPDTSPFLAVKSLSKIPPAEGRRLEFF
uniref:G-protein coupled receptors family 1 profile domain-containing protein n=1 Tax=Meloidogyne incognita TaxID=6306 RepID=A0A914KT92_MELIC